MIIQLRNGTIQIENHIATCPLSHKGIVHLVTFLDVLRFYCSRRIPISRSAFVDRDFTQIMIDIASHGRQMQTTYISRSKATLRAHQVPWRVFVLKVTEVTGQDVRAGARST